MTDREPVEDGGDPACWAHLFEDEGGDDVGPGGDEGAAGHGGEGEGEAEER